jgi:hypothetical protein
MAAFRTRSVSIRQRNGFVQKEQLRPSPRGHDLTLPPAKVEPTSDPAADSPVTDDFTLLVVQSAAIAEQRAPSSDRDDFTGWSDPVPQRHGCSPAE